MLLIGDGNSDLDILHQMESIETPVPHSMGSSSHIDLGKANSNPFQFGPKSGNDPTSGLSGAMMESDPIDEEEENETENLCGSTRSTHSVVAPIAPNPPQIALCDLDTPSNARSPHKSTFDRNLDDVVSSNDLIMGDVVRDMAMSHDENMLKMASLMNKIDDKERRVAVKKSTFDRQLDDVVDANEQLMDHLVRDMAFSVTQKQNGVAAVDMNGGDSLNGNTTTQSSLSTHSGTDTKQRFKSIRERIQYFDLKSPSTENVQTVQSIGSIAASPYKENATVSSHGTMSFLQTVGRDDGGHWK